MRLRATTKATSLGGRTFRAVFAAVVAILLVAVCDTSSAEQPPWESERSCKVDTDCACGTHITTHECFAGNKAYVDTSRQCPDFCMGFDGRRVLRCVDGECKSIHADH